jgi:hypothetical protein
MPAPCCHGSSQLADGEEAEAVAEKPERCNRLFRLSMSEIITGLQLCHYCSGFWACRSRSLSSCGFCTWSK